MSTTTISQILKEGTVISTMLDASYDWQQNIVQKVEDNVLSIPLLDSYVNKLILQGTGIVIKYATEYYEYLFDGVVSNINLSAPGNVSIKITKTHEKINTRAFTRFDIYLPSNIKPTKGNASYFSIVTNISLMGMAFTSNHDFCFGDECSVSIHLPNSKIIKAKGEIKRKVVKENINDYGLHFNEITDLNSTALSDYILSLEDGNQKLKTQFFDEVKDD